MYSNVVAFGSDCFFPLHEMLAVSQHCNKSAVYCGGFT